MKKIKFASIALVLVLAIFTGATPTVAEACDRGAEAIVSNVNSQRVSRGLSSLITHPGLSASASYKSSDLVKYKYWSHNNPITGEKFSQAIRKFYNSPYLGENLARRFGCADQVVAAWMSSPGHRANILYGSWKYVGASWNNEYVVIHFGK